MFRISAARHPPECLGPTTSSAAYIAMQDISGDVTPLEPNYFDYGEYAEVWQGAWVEESGRTIPVSVFKLPKMKLPC